MDNDPASPPISRASDIATQPFGYRHPLVDAAQPRMFALGSGPINLPNRGDNLPSETIDLPELNKRLLRSGHDYAPMEITPLDAKIYAHGLEQVKPQDAP